MTTSVKKSKQTPNYDHVLDDKILRTNVYEPEADSFLFLDALDAEIGNIGATVISQIQKRKFRTSTTPSSGAAAPVVFRCVEVGPGSGIVITHLGMVLRTYLQELACNPITSYQKEEISNISTNTEVVEKKEVKSNEEDAGAVVVVVEFHAIDMNPLAVKAATETWRRNIVVVEGKGPQQPLSSSTSSSWPETHIVSLRLSSLDGECTTTTTNVSIVFRACFSTGNLFHVDAVDTVNSCDRSVNTSIIATGGSISTPLSPLSSSYYDLVLFNPPYVPTDEVELQDALDKKDLITAAWCGGPRGRVVVDRFFRDINSWWFPSEHNEHVMCFVVAIRQNEPIDMAQFFKREVFEAATIRSGGDAVDGNQPVLLEVMPEGDDGGVVVGPLVGCTRASPPLPLMVAKGTTNSSTDGITIEFKAKAVAARYTGEHLSILKFDAIRRN